MTLHRESYKVIGLMSGTSLDGIDAALINLKDTDELKVEIIEHMTFPYPKSLKEKLLEISNPVISKTADISLMNMLLGELFAEAALQVVERAHLSLSEIDLIGSHGQTVFHQPEEVESFGKMIKSTLQIGDISVIAERTGIPTVGDFRTRDMAAGGQGAPLVPFTDYYLFRKKEYGRVLVNIGGISNITVLPPNCKENDVIAYDTGPGNMVIDLFVNWATKGEMSFDEDGKLASQGKVQEQWLTQLLRHPYFQKSYPKSTGREEFGYNYAKALWDEAERNRFSIHDRLSTVTYLTAVSLANEINRYVQNAKIKEVIVSGGGLKNKYLMDILQLNLRNVNVLSSDSLGINSDAKEAICFGLLGYFCMQKKTNSLRSATGARHSTIMGKIAW